MMEYMCLLVRMIISLESYILGFMNFGHDEQVLNYVKQRAVFAIHRQLPSKPSPSRGPLGKNLKTTRACKPSRKPQKNWSSSVIAGSMPTSPPTPLLLG